jgi:KDO2-lipid IV(A) lauroyltransferase
MAAGALTDLREGGAWTVRQRAKNDLLYVAVLASLAVARRAPRPLLRAAGAGVAALAWALLARERRTALANLARAFPAATDEERRALARAAYRELGRHLADAVAMLDAARPLEPLPFAPGTREVFERAVREGRGVVFASAHLGPWERVAASIVAAGVPMTVMAREAYDPRLTRAVYERLRVARGVRVIWRGGSRGKGSSAAILRALRRGEVLGVPMDLASRVPSIDVPFLGIPAPTAVGPARLALRTGAAVLVGSAARDGTLSAVRIETEGATERELTLRINDELGARVRAYPEGWLWMHERFPTL